MTASIAARRGGIIAAAAALALFFAPKAHAGLLVASATSCDDVKLSQPFAPWLDNSNYFSLGGFENGAPGWTLSGGAGVTADNEPWHVGAAGDSQSLDLPAGSSAVSPTVCVGIDKPSIRFFARRDAHGFWGGLSTLKIEAIVQDNAGNQYTVPVGVTGGGSAWGPTAPLPVIASLLPLLPGEQTPVAFKFTVNGSADWHIDDTYVDPYRCC